MSLLIKLLLSELNELAQTGWQIEHGGLPAFTKACENIGKDTAIALLFAALRKIHQLPSMATTITNRAYKIPLPKVEKFAKAMALVQKQESSAFAKACQLIGYKPAMALLIGHLAKQVANWQVATNLITQ